MGEARFIILLAILVIYCGWDFMKSDKRLKFKVISTEGHKQFFGTRKEAEKYIEGLGAVKYNDDTWVGSFVEFRVYEVSKK